MKKILTTIVTANMLLPCFCQISFNGIKNEVITVKPESSTGLDDVYVVYSVAGASISYASQNPGSKAEWSKFSNLGGGYAEPIDDIVYEGALSTLTNVEGDMGYIIRDESKTVCFWVVDYSRHAFRIDGIAVSDESDCQTVALSFNGTGGDIIRYYTINGQGKELSREIELKYNTLEFDADMNLYVEKEATAMFDHVSATLYADSPLCNTDFTLVGDRFLRKWGMPQEASTSTYATPSIQATTSATQNRQEVDNEQSSGLSGGLGGSAPADIAFNAVITDAVAFTEWQMSRDMNFDIIDYRETNPDFEYTFRDAGVTYVRFMVSNASGSCDYYSPTYEVSIGESDIKCPNAFSPGSSEGVNDMWKVSYKSIVSFECHIFNRWGVKVASFNNPADGWDGKYNGKFVPAGVYYYVINAKGADGKNYKLKGDINIISFKRSQTSSGNPAN